MSLLFSSEPGDRVVLEVRTGYGSASIELSKNAIGEDLRIVDGHDNGCGLIRIDLGDFRSDGPRLRRGGREPSAWMPPGDWLKALITVVTFGRIRPCMGCRSRLRAMNRAGWRGLPRLAFHSIVQHFRG